MDLRSRLAVVTGAASGIGRATSLELARRGARLALLDIDAVGVRATVDDVAALGGEARAHVVDMADADAVAAIAERIVREQGDVDLLVNNAGIAVAAPFARTTEDDWDRLFAVNVRGPLRLARALMPSMIHRKNGQIVFVASLAGLIGAPGLVAYTTTKFALVGLAEALRLELEETGVGITVVCPGFVRTNFAKATRYDASPLARFLDDAPAWYGLRKEHVARALVDAALARKPLVVLGPEKMGWWLKRLAPEAAFAVTRWVARRAGAMSRSVEGGA